MNYFIQVDGESHGPLTAEQVRLRLSEQGLQLSDLARREDSTEWVPLDSMEEFRDVAKSQALQPLDNPLAGLSLMLGLLSVFLVGLLIVGVWRVPVFWLASILAIVFGHWAMSKIHYSIRTVKGRGMARSGLWLGYFITFAPFIPVQSGSHLGVRGNQTKAISNCRQILTTLHLYAYDHNGKYPDAAIPGVRSSNEAFRRMFVDGQADNEIIFGCPLSIFNPDGNIGVAPDFREALKPGENHWEMTKGLTDSSDGNIPLVFENTFVPSWPPKWNMDRAPSGKPGRAWPGGKIVIGLNDSSVSIRRLESDSGREVGLKPEADGSPVFPAIVPKPEILQVEGK